MIRNNIVLCSNSCIFNQRNRKHAIFSHLQTQNLGQFKIIFPGNQKEIITEGGGLKFNM
jgi:hypothetical protein